MSVGPRRQMMGWQTGDSRDRRQSLAAGRTVAAVSPPGPPKPLCEEGAMGYK